MAPAEAGRACPPEGQGNAAQCRYAITEGETAEWDTAAVVPAP